MLIKKDAVDVELKNEIISGLKSEQKTLPCKLFYDKRGSILFDLICELDEYYLTRTETKIMQDNIVDIAETLGEKFFLIELGSGSSTKTRILLEHLKNIIAYVPIDISEKHLHESVNILNDEFPKLNIFPIMADYTQEFKLPIDGNNHLKKNVYYPGSTIGNFNKEEAQNFLKRISKICGENGGLLIGVDLVKDREILLNAYNDKKGITSAFNLNILRNINNQFQSDFDSSKFKHKAIFNEEEHRIEMYLISKENQKVTIEGDDFYFEQGEKILTEYSTKYSIENFKELTSENFEFQKIWTDEKNYFAVMYFVIR